MTEGDCFLCGGSFTKRGMGRHLESCRKENFDVGEKGKTLHLRVSGRRRAEYWMHLAVRPETTLEELDAFLRAV